MTAPEWSSSQTEPGPEHQYLESAFSVQKIISCVAETMENGVSSMSLMSLNTVLAVITLCVHVCVCMHTCKDVTGP